MQKIFVSDGANLASGKKTSEWGGGNRLDARSVMVGILKQVQPAAIARK